MKRKEELITLPLGKVSVTVGMKPSISSGSNGGSDQRSGKLGRFGLLILNADDWGRDSHTTEQTLSCIDRGTVSSVSAMMFMQDSERSATIAREQGIDAGLHINLTTPFSAPHALTRLREHQERLSKYLLRSRFAQVVFHPGLTSSFEYVVAAQLDEFYRLYGAKPERLDGHHHMHLCANVLLGKLLPDGTIVRRSFSFRSGEKSFANRAYRRIVDGLLVRRHCLPDFLFSLPPLEPQRLQRIFSIARESVVELETHPVNPEEFRFLAEGEIFRLAGDLPIARGFASPVRERVEGRDQESQ